MKGSKAAIRERGVPKGEKGKTSGNGKKGKEVVEERYTTDEETEEEVEATPYKPFRFLDLPFELRLKIYDEVLLFKDTVDLDPRNFFRILPRLSLLLTSHQVHDEAYQILYGQPLSIYPMHGRFFHTKKPLLARLSPRYRSAVNTIAWRIGPGWGKPPKNQNTMPSLGLADCTSLRTLKIFIECDPSDAIFNGYRGAGATEDTYKYFCINLLLGMLEQVPSLARVEIDAWPSVKKESPIVLGLVRHIERAGKTLIWGPQRGWDAGIEESNLLGIEDAMASLTSWARPGLVDVPA